MTKFIYDTKSIMLRGWEIARAYKKTAKIYDKRSLREWFKVCLPDAWKEAKDAMKIAVAKDKIKSSKGRRYLELLAVAERDGLNHGASWYCGDREIEVMGMNPMHEGELVCYVYAN